MESPFERSCRWPWLLMVALLGCASLACDSQESKAGYKPSANAPPASSPHSFEQRESFKAEMAKALDQLELRMRELGTKIESGVEGAQEESKQLLAELKGGFADLRGELDELGSATRDGWEEVRGRVERKLEELRRKVNESLSG